MGQALGKSCGKIASKCFENKEDKIHDIKKTSKEYPRFELFRWTLWSWFDLGSASARSQGFLSFEWYDMLLRETFFLFISNTYTHTTGSEWSEVRERGKGAGMEVVQGLLCADAGLRLTVRDVIQDHGETLFGHLRVRDGEMEDTKQVNCEVVLSVQ